MNPRARWHPWAMLGPTLALLVVFFLLPIGVAAYQSLFSWDLLTPPRFVGTANYSALAAHGELLHVALRTLGYSALVVSGTMTLGLGLALLLDRPGRFFGFVRASVFSAYVVSWVAVALLWMWILDGNAGLVGRSCCAHSAGRPVALLGDPTWALPALALVGVWKLTGYSMIVFLAGPAGRAALAARGGGARRRGRLEPASGT